jgi:parallel beta-helix repeat protein
MGGIGACGASPLIVQNRILANEDAYYGAGIYLEDCSNTVITGNEIASNYTWSGYGVAKGGGIYGTHSEALIERNLIYINTADPPYGAGGGGIALEDSGSYQVYNNTLAYNESIMSGSGTGGGIHIAGFFGPSPNADVQNNIIVYNHGGGVHYAPVGPGQLLLNFNDVWGNDHFDYFGCIPGRSDISANPQFVGGSPFSYELTQTSPCIDAGAFVTEPDPDGTRADMGAFYFDQEGINVALVPNSWPIVIPAAGASFNYTIHLTNHTAGATEFDIWVDVQLPDSTVFGPIILREGLTFNPNQHAQRDLTQAVPGGAPAGNYLYMAHTGDYSTGAIYHETLMPFTKEGTEGFSGHWAVSPDPGNWGGGLRPGTSQQQSISLSASPNPFNPAAMLRFDLPQSGHVALKIYDLTGRTVATLLNRDLPPGSHAVQFDGCHLTSGVYIAVLESGAQRAVQRLLLLK